MLVLKWISVLALAVVTYAEAPRDNQPTALKVETTYLPSGECPVSAQKGDQVHIHYVKQFSFWSGVTVVEG